MTTTTDSSIRIAFPSDDDNDGDSDCPVLPKIQKPTATSASKRCNTFVIVPWIENTQSFCDIDGQVEFGKQALNNAKRTDQKVYQHLLYLPNLNRLKEEQREAFLAQQVAASKCQEMNVEGSSSADSANRREETTRINSGSVQGKGRKQQRGHKTSSSKWFSHQAPHHFLPFFAPALAKETQFNTYRLVVAGHTTHGDRANNITAEEFALHMVAMLRREQSVFSALKSRVESATTNNSAGSAGGGRKGMVRSSSARAISNNSPSPIGAVGSQPRTVTTKSSSSPALSLEIIFQTCNSALCVLDSSMSHEQMKEEIVNSTFIGRFTRLFVEEWHSRYDGGGQNTGDGREDDPPPQLLRKEEEEDNNSTTFPSSIALTVKGYRGFFTQLTNAKETLVQDDFDHPTLCVSSSKCEVALSSELRLVFSPVPPLLPRPRPCSDSGSSTTTSGVGGRDRSTTTSSCCKRSHHHHDDDGAVTQAPTLLEETPRVLCSSLAPLPLFRVSTRRGIFDAHGFVASKRF